MNRILPRRAFDFLLRESVLSSSWHGEQPKIEIMLATHNQQSVEKAMAGMKRYGMDRSSHAVSFAQLYGMSDHLTIHLGRAGYRAYKYVPYGEVSEVIAYLDRRAKENSSAVSGAAQELPRVEKELWRRLNPMSAFS